MADERRDVLKGSVFDQTKSRKTRGCFVIAILCVILCITLSISVRLPCSEINASDWQRRSTPHFCLFYQKSDHLLADYIMEKAEEDYKRIVEHIGINPEITAKVYLAPDLNTYIALQPEGRNTPEWSIGVFYPEQSLILLLSPKARKIGHPDLRQIMAHELTHFIMHTIRREKDVDLPAWLHEGLAMYEARQWDWRCRTVMAQTSLGRSFIPLLSLAKGFPAEKDLADRAYAQSISVITYIINKYGPSALNGIIKNLVDGHTTQEAFENVLGVSIEDFEKQWHVYLRMRYTWIPVITSGFTIWFLISLMAFGVYIYKKKLDKKKMAVWEIEEQIDSLS
ncbi:hypothetical protein JXL19_09500 [bacterium]|nr:hypothetical protein [bacterium]